MSFPGSALTRRRGLWRTDAFTCVAALLATGLSSCGAGAQTSSPAKASAVALPFHVLHRPASRGDIIPRAFAANLQKSDESPITPRDVAAARRVLQHDPAWLLPAEGEEVCLARVLYPLVSAVRGGHFPPILTHICKSVRAAELGELVEVQTLSTSTSHVGPVRVIGVAPDGVATIVIRATGGRSTRAPVIDNTYEAVVVHPTAVEFPRGAAPSVRVPLVSP